jgi:hypothetical protein
MEEKMDSEPFRNDKYSGKWTVWTIWTGKDENGWDLWEEQRKKRDVRNPAD